MTTIQPISTLRDHNNVLQLPTPEHLRRRRKPSAILEDDPDPAEGLEKSRQNMINSMQNQKVKNLNEMLMTEPEKPEIDQNMIDKNRNLAKKAALIQVLDAIGDTVHMNRKQDEAVIAPTRYGDLGLSALDNIRNLDEQHRLDLRRYGQRKERVDEFNRQTIQKAGQFNAGVDTNITKMNYDHLKDEQNKEIQKQEKEKDRNFRVALRYMTAGNYSAAARHLQQAGLVAPPGKGIGQPAKNGGRETTPANVGAEPTVATTTPPPPGITPENNTQPEDAAPARYPFREVRNSLDSETQAKVQRSEFTLKNVLENNLLTAKDPQNIDDILHTWKKINRMGMLRAGISEEKVDTVNQEMLEYALAEKLFEPTGPTGRRNIFAAWVKATHELIKQEGVPVEKPETNSQTSFKERLMGHLHGPGQEQAAQKDLSDEDIEEELRRRFRDLVRKRTGEPNPGITYPELMWELGEIARLRNDGEFTPVDISWPYRRTTEFMNNKIKGTPIGDVRDKVRHNLQIYLDPEKGYKKKMNEKATINMLFDRWGGQNFKEERTMLGPVASEDRQTISDASRSQLGGPGVGVYQNKGFLTGQAEGQHRPQELQQALMNNIINATDPETRKQAANEWLRRNTELLLAEGVPENQVDQLNEQMFDRMMQEIAETGRQVQSQVEVEPAGGTESKKRTREPSQNYRLELQDLKLN